MKKDFIEELEKDEQYQALIESVPEAEREVVKAQVHEFMKTFSDTLLDAFDKVASDPEAMEEFVKELNKLQGNAT